MSTCRSIPENIYLKYKYNHKQKTHGVNVVLEDVIISFLVSLPIYYNNLDNEDDCSRSYCQAVSIPNAPSYWIIVPTAICDYLLNTLLILQMFHVRPL